MANTSSAKYSSIARPYALAAFEYAREKHELPAWKSFLDAAACMTNQHDIAQLLNNPGSLPEKLLTLYSEVLSSQLNEQRKNLLRLLVQERRLNILPGISEAFNEEYAALEKIANVRIETAIQLSSDIEQKIASAISRRTKQEVTLECEVNPSIIGGAIIYIGDNVIDGSIRGKLTRLYQSLTD